MPHISYYDATNGDLKYAIKSGGSWGTPEIVDGTGVVIKYTSIAVDAQGMPHISYYDATHGDLKYAVKTGEPVTPWIIETIDATGDVGLYSSITLSTTVAPPEQ